MTEHLVETSWLEANLGAAHLRIIDGSWYLPAMERNAQAEYNTGHIPGAVYFDIDAISRTDTDLPHMLPGELGFAEAVGKMGISDTDHIVIYDGTGLFSAARVWWMFRAMGAEKVSVLNGGLKAWKAEDRPLTSELTVLEAATFSARLQPNMIRHIDEVLAYVADGSRQVIDARPAARFTGEVAEPRAGLRSGHMPNSANTPIDKFLSADGRMKPASELRQVLQEAGVDLTKPAVTSCGSGVTAAIPYLAMTLLGKTDISLYDGSWTEWGGLEHTPVETS